MSALPRPGDLEEKDINGIELGKHVKTLIKAVGTLPVAEAQLTQAELSFQLLHEDISWIYRNPYAYRYYLQRLYRPYETLTTETKDQVSGQNKSRVDKVIRSWDDLQTRLAKFNEATSQMHYTVHYTVQHTSYSADLPDLLKVYLRLSNKLDALKKELDTVLATRQNIEARRPKLQATRQKRRGRRRTRRT